MTVRATTLNHHDLWSLRGVGIGPEELPRVLGCDGAGVDPDGNEVVLYPLVTDPDWRGPEIWDPSRTMLSERVDGTFAEVALVPTGNLVAKPRGMSWASAATASMTWLTGYRMLFTQAQLQPGQLVLVQGSGGGVNSGVIQLATAAGIRVWVTGRDASRRERALELGAEQAFQPGAWLPEKVDAVIDNVGAATWSHSINVLKPGGCLVTCGATSGESPRKTELRKIFFRELRVLGSSAGTRDELAALLQFVHTKSIEPIVANHYRLAEARRGFEQLAAGKVFGNIIFTP
ncbi:MAG: zinc-binding dehydrogenase [Brooklawnia sp.]